MANAVITTYEQMGSDHHSTIARISSCLGMRHCDSETVGGFSGCRNETGVSVSVGNEPLAVLGVDIVDTESRARTHATLCDTPSAE